MISTSASGHKHNNNNANKKKEEKPCSTSGDDPGHCRVRVSRRARDSLLSGKGRTTHARHLRGKANLREGKSETQMREESGARFCCCSFSFICRYLLSIFLSFYLSFILYFFSSLLSVSYPRVSYLLSSSSYPAIILIKHHHQRAHKSIAQNDQILSRDGLSNRVEAKHTTVVMSSAWRSRVTNVILRSKKHRECSVVLIEKGERDRWVRSQIALVEEMAIAGGKVHKV
jgi:hypothetical protein